MKSGADNNLKLVEPVRKKDSLLLRLFRLLGRLVIIGVLGFLLWQLDAYFRIKTVIVEGTGDYDSERIAEAAGITPGRSILLVGEEGSAERLEANYPGYRDVEVSRKLPDTVVIRFAERAPAAYIYSPDGYWIIDRETVAYSLTQDPQEGFPVIYDIDTALIRSGEEINCLERASTLRKFFAAWPRGDRIDPQRMSLRDSYNLVVYTEEGLQIWLGDGNNLEYKISLINESLHYISPDPDMSIDVRSGRRLVLSPGTKNVEKEVDP